MLIKKVRKDQAAVDFVDSRGDPVQRTYMRGAPSVNMIGRYDDYNENFEVDLWEESQGFILDLTHLPGQALPQGLALLIAIANYFSWNPTTLRCTVSATGTPNSLAG